MPHLSTVAQKMKWILALQDFLYQVGNHMAHRQLDIARISRLSMERPLFPYSHTVEWTDDGVGKLVLFKSALGEILASQFLESVSGMGRRTVKLFPFGRRKNLRFP